MPDFGNAGTRTIRQNRLAVIVNIANGEYLFFRLTVQGAQPEFAFACEHRTLRSSTVQDFPGHPQQVYEWTWGKDPLDSDNNDDMYGVRVKFTAAIKYTLLVVHRRKDDSVIKVLKDIDYASQDPSDQFQELLHVFS